MQSLKDKLGYLVESKTFWVSAIGVTAVVANAFGVVIDQEQTLLIVQAVVGVIFGRRIAQAAFYKPENKEAP